MKGFESLSPANGPRAALAALAVSNAAGGVYPSARKSLPTPFSLVTLIRSDGIHRR